jgi:hypothetical protein
MESNIHIISEFPDKHHTEIRWNDYYKSYRVMYFINYNLVFKFYPDTRTCDFIFTSASIVGQILELGSYDCALLVNDEYCMKLNRFEKIKELINNHTLSDEEKIAFKDFLYEPEFKLKFVD